jgi:hypothetical protein
MQDNTGVAEQTPKIKRIDEDGDRVMMESDPELHEVVDDAFRLQNVVMFVTVSGNAVSNVNPATLAPKIAVAKPAPTLVQPLQFLSVATCHYESHEPTVMFLPLLGR